MSHDPSPPVRDLAQEYNTVHQLAQIWRDIARHEEQIRYNQNQLTDLHTHEGKLIRQAHELGLTDTELRLLHAQG